jgi:hypothetical protein
MASKRSFSLSEMDLSALIIVRPFKPEIYFQTQPSLKNKMNTYHSRFIPEGLAEVSLIFLRDTHVLPKLVSYEKHCRRDRW